MSHVFVCLCAFIVMFDLCVPSLFLNFQKRSQKCEACVLIQEKKKKKNLKKFVAWAGIEPGTIA